MAFSPAEVYVVVRCCAMTYLLHIVLEHQCVTLRPAQQEGTMSNEAFTCWP